MNSVQLVRTPNAASCKLRSTGFHLLRSSPRDRSTYPCYGTVIVSDRSTSLYYGTVISVVKIATVSLRSSYGGATLMHVLRSDRTTPALFLAPTVAPHLPLKREGTYFQRQCHRWAVRNDCLISQLQNLDNYSYNTCVENHSL